MQAEAAARPRDLPGEVFVRVGGDGAFLRATKPAGPRTAGHRDHGAGEAVPARRDRASTRPSCRAIIKHADGEYVRVADVQYNPSHDAIALRGHHRRGHEGRHHRQRARLRRRRHFLRLRAVLPRLQRRRARPEGRRAGGDRALPALRPPDRRGGGHARARRGQCAHRVQLQARAGRGHAPGEGRARRLQGHLPRGKRRGGPAPGAQDPRGGRPARPDGHRHHHPGHEGQGLRPAWWART